MMFRSEIVKPPFLVNGLLRRGVDDRVGVSRIESTGLDNGDIDNLGVDGGVMCDWLE